MTRSKGKARRADGGGQRRRFVVVHQDKLMLAFARGYVPHQDVPLMPQAKVTEAAIAQASGGIDWGAVFLLELPSAASESEANFVEQPLLLADVIACWAPSEDAALDIEARMDTFDDTVPTALEIKADPSLFPGDHDALPGQPPLGLPEQEGLQLDTDATIASCQPSLDSDALEKVAGGLSTIGALNCFPSPGRSRLSRQRTTRSIGSRCTPTT